MRSWEPQQTKTVLFFLFSFWDKWGGGGARVWSYVVPSLPSLVFLLVCTAPRAAATQGGDAHCDTVTRADTLEKGRARTAIVLREEPDNAAKSNGLGRSKSKEKNTRQKGRDDDSLRPHSTGID